MRYAILDRQNRVVRFEEYTQAEYDALSVVQKAELYLADDPAITSEYVFHDRWWSPVELRDVEFNADPQAYINKRTTKVNLYLQGQFAAGFEYNGHMYKGEANDQLWMNAFLKLLDSGLTTPPIHWITLDNDVVTFDTIEEFEQLAGFFFQWAQTVVFGNLALKQAMRAATTREDVDALYEPFVAQMIANGIEPKTMTFM